MDGGWISEIHHYDFLKTNSFFQTQSVNTFPSLFPNFCDLIFFPKDAFFQAWKKTFQISGLFQVFHDRTNPVRFRALLVQVNLNAERK